MRRQIGAKVGRQVLKDYVLFPVLTGPLAPVTLAGNATANVVRNLWAFTIIFCGHFPDGAPCSPRRRSPTSPAAAGTSGRSSARPTSRAARSSTS